MPSTGSHLPNYAARCKMGERHRLHAVYAVHGLNLLDPTHGMTRGRPHPNQPSQV
jgi:hypothetical protein